MLILYLLIGPILLILFRLVLLFIVFRYEKFSYDGFFAFEFADNSCKDIFYSAKQDWQKNFVYTYIYDILSSLFGMIIDTDPIYYNNKNLIMINGFLPNLLKNSADSREYSSKIVNRIFDTNKRNVVLLDGNVYSKFGVRIDE